MPGYTSFDKQILTNKIGEIADKVQDMLNKDNMELPTISDVSKMYKFISTTNSEHTSKIKEIFNNIFVHKIKSFCKEDNINNESLRIENYNVQNGELLIKKNDLKDGVIDFYEYIITLENNKIIRLPEDINFQYVVELIHLYRNNLISASVEFINPKYGETDIDMDVIFSNELMKKLTITNVMINADKILKNLLYNDPDYQSYRIFFRNIFKNFTCTRSTQFCVNGIPWEIVDDLLLIQDKSNIMVKTIKYEIDSKYLENDNINKSKINSLDEINLKINNIEKYVKRFDTTYTDKYDLLALEPENKNLLELWNLSRAITIFKIIHEYGLLYCKPLDFIDEISNIVTLKNMVIKYNNTNIEDNNNNTNIEHNSNIEDNNINYIIVGGVVITLLDDNEFKNIVYENKEIIGNFLRSLCPCSDQVLKIAIENFEEFNKIPKIKNLLINNESFRLFIGKPTYSDDVLFDRFTGEYVESIYELSNRNNIIPLFHEISKVIIEKSRSIAKEKLITYIEKILYTFENNHNFVVIILDNYKLMNLFIRSLIENFFIQDFSDYLVEDVYNEIYNSQECKNELYKFGRLLLHDNEDQILKFCPKIYNIIKKYNLKLQEKLYFYAKTRILSFI